LVLANINVLLTAVEEPGESEFGELEWNVWGIQSQSKISFDRPILILHGHTLDR
jgi:hypothetical protein